MLSQSSKNDLPAVDSKSLVWWGLAIGVCTTLAGYAVRELGAFVAAWRHLGLESPNLPYLGIVVFPLFFIVVSGVPAWFIARFELAKRIPATSHRSFTWFVAGVAGALMLVWGLLERLGNDLATRNRLLNFHFWMTVVTFFLIRFVVARTFRRLSVSKS